MMSLKTKYLIQKLCFGALFLYFGFSEEIDAFVDQMVGTTSFNSYVITIIKAALYIVCMFAFSVTLVMTHVKKIEVEDESARKHTHKAQSLVYRLLLLTGIIYAFVVGLFINLNVSLNYKMIFVILGVCQIFEYLFFVYYERKSDFYE